MQRFIDERERLGASTLLDVLFIMENFAKGYRGTCTCTAGFKGFMRFNVHKKTFFFFFQRKPSLTWNGWPWTDGPFGSLSALAAPMLTATPPCPVRQSRDGRASATSLTSSRSHSSSSSCTAAGITPLIGGAASRLRIPTRGARRPQG